MVRQERKKDILIIGGGGFIGRNLINSLRNKNVNIYSVSKQSTVPAIKNIHADLVTSDFSFLKRIKPDYVVYLGTISSPKEADINNQGSFDTNVIALQKFFEIAKDLKIKKIILLSSIVLYAGDLNHPCKEDDKITPYKDIYCFSKYLLESLAEYYRRNCHLPITVFRLSNTYGPHQSSEKVPLLVPSLFQQAFAKKKIEVWNSSPIRDWIYVEDVCMVIQKELETHESGVYNVATGKGRKVEDVVKIISKLTGAPFKNLEKAVNPPMKVVCNMTKLKKHLRYVPNTTLEVGLKKTYEYYK
jgi:dTDP-glucose 4,6-dehydratase